MRCELVTSRSGKKDGFGSELNGRKRRRPGGTFMKNEGRLHKLNIDLNNRIYTVHLLMQHRKG